MYQSPKFANIVKMSVKQMGQIKKNAKAKPAKVLNPLVAVKWEAAFLPVGCGPPDEEPVRVEVLCEPEMEPEVEPETEDGADVGPGPAKTRLFPMEVNVVQDDDEGTGCADGVTGSPWWNVEVP